MIIELNKHYINAIGDVVFINEYIKRALYPFRDLRNYGYDIKGRYIDSSTDSALDLISECIPDILNNYMDKAITQKEFIQQHIDYYTKGKK